MSASIPYDDEVSDDDLPLEELDPATGSRNPPSRSGTPQNANTTRHLRRLRNFGLRRAEEDLDAPYKRIRRKESEDDLQELLDHEDGGSDHAYPNTNDYNQGDHYDTDQSHDKSLKQRKTGLAGFFDRLRASPQSELEEAYDPSTNRQINVGYHSKFPPNIISNAKYTPWSFLPRTLYNEFSFFFNLYFLLVALSQVIPQLRIGYLSTYTAPLAFVLTITLGKEAYDDVTRRRRDAELNSERYTSITFNNATPSSRKSQPSSTSQHRGRLAEIEDEETRLDSDSEGLSGTAQEFVKMSKDIKVGDILKLSKGHRVPADAVILKSVPSEGSSHDENGDGEAFIRTDQLDGETDWKLRIAPSLSQSLSLQQLFKLTLSASKPSKKVNEFLGTLTYPQSHSRKERSLPLSIDNTAWANTVLASTATVYAVVVYTGPQTRQALSTTASRTKTGLLEYEINNLTKILCGLTLLLSFILVAAYKFESPDGRPWYIAVMRYLILFSTIVPISLRVNLDMGKSVYAWFINRDADIPGTIVRTSTIPEDLGRIEYLLSDKTGTLTQNDMQLKKIHVGTVSYAGDAMADVSAYVKQGFGSSDVTVKNAASLSNSTIGQGTSTRGRREVGSRVRDVVLALALCHNVTPTIEDIDGREVTTYQASSPDEIAIIRWTESCGLRLAHRDRHTMMLESTHSGEVVAKVEILHLFPFTSESKRMSIMVRFVGHNAQPTEQEGETADPVWFFQKGADTVMTSIVAKNDWLDEETANMAREGLRTLVVGRKKLAPQQYQLFNEQYKQASLSLHDRDTGMARVVSEHLEQDLELLGVTGVEDKLQQDVKPSLELLRNAGVKIWMLTGDKVETARCVAVSSKLVARGQYVHTVAKSKSLLCLLRFYIPC